MIRMTLTFRKPFSSPYLVYQPIHPRPLTTYATFHYLENRPEYQTIKPYHINIPAWGLPAGRQSNEFSIPYSNIPVKGLRSQLQEFTLDRNGFQVKTEEQKGPNSLYDSLKYEEYADHQKHLPRMFAAVESFLMRKMPGVEAVVPFSTQVRRRDTQFPALPRGTDASQPQPVQGVHVDFTPDCAKAEIGEALVDRGYPNLKGRRWQIISTWKPLFGPLQDWPLALLDYTSLNTQRDLVASDNIYTHVIRETYNVLHSDRHRWYYLENQQPDEVLLFKTFDSLSSKGNARVCPHAAFRDPLAPENVRPRESFECQAIVIYPEGSLKDNVYEEPLPSESTPPE
ncbi:hypothetical protein BJX99DRAFT_221806 [Aspergillus californicus]